MEARIIGIAGEALKQVFGFIDLILRMDPDSPAVVFVLDLVVNPLHVQEIAERQSARFVWEMANQAHTGCVKLKQNGGLDKPLGFRVVGQFGKLTHYRFPAFFSCSLRLATYLTRALMKRA